MRNMDRRVKKTKASILKAFKTLVLEKDYSEITVKEITERADTARRTFYMHYNSIDDILNELHNELADKVITLLEGKEFLKQSPQDFKELFYGINELMNENYELYKRIASANSYTFFVDTLKELLCKTIANTMKKQLSLNENSVIACSEYLASGIMALYISWLRSDFCMTLEELTGLATAITYNGAKAFLE